MSDAAFEEVRRLQQERNAAAAGKKGSKTFDPSNQRTDSSTKASLTENFDTELYDRNGADKFSGYDTSLQSIISLPTWWSWPVNQEVLSKQSQHINNISDIFISQFGTG